MRNKKTEEYKKMQKESQITVSLYRDLMECVEIFKGIPVPKNCNGKLKLSQSQNQDNKHASDPECDD